MAALKPHAVLIPFPAQGHVTPMMQLAKLLHSRGFHITFVNTEFNHRRLLRSKGLDYLDPLDDFRFETIPDGLPPSDKDATQDVPPLCYSTSKNCLAPFVQLIERLNSTAGVPGVSLIIGDGIMSFAVEAGKILGISEVQFWTASAGGFMGYISYSELIKRGLTPFKDESYITNGSLDTLIDWIPGMKNIKLKDLPSFIRTTDRNDIMLNFMGEEAQNCLNSSAILFNTFDDLEQDVLDAIKSKFPNIHTIGPLPMLGQQLLPKNELKYMRSSLWKEDSECIKWLDQRDPNSVIYVNFGSIAVMTEKQLTEFAWGLANSNHHFLWIIRPDAVTVTVTVPEEFILETEDRGLLTGWCPQDVVLSHPSIGLFLTHCGWNSTLEAICGGVPVICWPYFAEQQTNCWYACNVWEIGMESNNDVRREELEELVKEMMNGEKGKKMRKNALDLKHKTQEATREGGSSYKNFDILVKEVLCTK